MSVNEELKKRGADHICTTMAIYLEQYARMNAVNGLQDVAHSQRTNAQRLRDVADLITLENAKIDGRGHPRGD